MRQTERIMLFRQWMIYHEKQRKTSMHIVYTLWGIPLFNAALLIHTLQEIRYVFILVFEFTLQPIYKGQ